MMFWPFAIEYAAYLWSHVPNTDYNNITSISPIKLYTGSKENFSGLKNKNSWGCPAYVLDPKLQDGESFQNGIFELDKVII